MNDLNTVEYWNRIWGRGYKDDRIDIIKQVTDRGNSAEYWDLLWSSPKRRYEKYSMQWAIWKAKKWKPKSILDAGCGNGRLLLGMKQILPEAYLFGIDISEVGIKKMKESYGIDGLVMNVYNLNNLDKKFDYIVTNHTLEHIWRDEDFVKLCYNKLNVGGHFLAAVPNNCSGPEETEEHVRIYDQAILEKLFLKVFGNVETKIIGNHLICWSEKREDVHKKMTLISNTIVKNGMPFIVPVIRSALPFVDKAIITVSVKSTDGTRQALEALQSPKIELYEENVADLGELTKERQKQVNLSDSDWIWFLDDDDYWESYEVDKCLHQLDDSVDALSVNPYQVLDKEHEDVRWINKKYFTKFFRNIDIIYRGSWPRDLIYKGDKLLYHKTNPKNKVVPHKFWHLAAVKKYSFRKFDLQKFDDLAGKPVLLDTPVPQEILNLL